VFCDWLVIDLDGFRLNHERARPFTHDNKDGTFFKAYKITDFPVGIMIAASEGVTRELPPQYQMAMQRRQSGLWEPYKGLVKR
jgi:hypothetical protein